MKENNFLTGKKGEEMAGRYLENKGFLIKERNFRTRFGEIDIVGFDKNILVFVEVKTKIGHEFGEPEEMINKGKLGKVRRMGEVYLQDKNLDVACRIDVVAVVLSGDGKIERIEHYENVY